jgi:hypothetical protein
MSKSHKFTRPPEASLRPPTANANKQTSMRAFYALQVRWHSGTPPHTTPTDNESRRDSQPDCDSYHFLRYFPQCGQLREHGGVLEEMETGLFGTTAV